MSLGGPIYSDLGAVGRLKSVYNTFKKDTNYQQNCCLKKTRLKNTIVKKDSLLWEQHYSKLKYNQNKPNDPLSPHGNITGFTAHGDFPWRS